MVKYVKVPAGHGEFVEAFIQAEGLAPEQIWPWEGMDYAWSVVQAARAEWPPSRPARELNSGHGLVLVEFTDGSQGLHPAGLVVNSPSFPDAVRHWRSVPPAAKPQTVTEAAAALIANVRRRYPGEPLHCPHMRALADAIAREKTRA